MTIKKTKVAKPKTGWVGFSIEDGYVSDFEYCTSEKYAKDNFDYYIKAENWPDPNNRPKGVCVGNIIL